VVWQWVTIALLASAIPPARNRPIIVIRRSGDSPEAMRCMRKRIIGIGVLSTW
jgi:hypothetical protein